MAYKGKVKGELNMKGTKKKAGGNNRTPKSSKGGGLPAGNKKLTDAELGAD